MDLLLCSSRFRAAAWGRHPAAHAVVARPGHRERHGSQSRGQGGRKGPTEPGELAAEAETGRKPAHHGEVPGGAQQKESRPAESAGVDGEAAAAHRGSAHQGFPQPETAAECAQNTLKYNSSLTLCCLFT
jgi:hypothetical protein